MRYLIINADGYGFTAGVTGAIEECVDFGTVRSISANVNFPHIAALPRLLQRHPHLSVGCHINPIVGAPVLPPDKVPTLVDDHGEFLYKAFTRHFLTGRIALAELRAEMEAQIDKTRALAGEAFSHIDFHMGLHRLPGLYDLFLDVVTESGVGRIRTHRYRVGMESRWPRLRHNLYLGARPTRIAKFLWNLWLRRQAIRRNLAMPDRRVEFTQMSSPRSIVLENYVRMLQVLPDGVNELIAHPGYVDAELTRWARYCEPRIRERGILLDPRFLDALQRSDVQLIGYRNLPID